tara:strand:- start:1171 stop:1470 length:300 start_codon:yes stop_codon:yes gene_type:complete
MTNHEIPIPVEITVKMSSEDFEYLYETSMNWKDEDWRVQDGRFVPMPNYTKWQRAYWFDNRVTLILAKSYLNHFEIEYDETLDDNENQFVLLTDFGGAL